MNNYTSFLNFEPKYLSFDLEDGTTSIIKNDEKSKYRIGLKINDRVETIYVVTAKDIQKQIKKYNGVLVYVEPMTFHEGKYYV